MDDRDDYEPEAGAPMEPVTERVRIIGAQPAGATAGGGREEPGAEEDAPSREAAVGPHGSGVEAPHAPTFDLFGEEPGLGPGPDEDLVHSEIPVRVVEQELQKLKFSGGKRGVPALVSDETPFRIQPEPI